MIKLESALLTHSLKSDMCLMLRVQLSSDSSYFKILREPRAGAASLNSIVLAVTSSIGRELYETLYHLGMVSNSVILTIQELEIGRCQVLGLSGLCSYFKVLRQLMRSCLKIRNKSK